MPINNPLQQFFRKPKFTIQLPSRGKWYPKNAIKNTDGQVEIYAMTASDETRAKTSEVLLNVNSLVDLLKSCVPDITNPELIPTVDLDALMLSIRRASYGDNLEYEVAVPQTNLTTKINLSIEKLVGELANVEQEWDETLNILSDNKDTVCVIIRPINVKSMFSVTKQILKHQQATLEISNNSQPTDQKIDQIDDQMKHLATLSVNMVADSIVKISIGDYSTENPAEIRQFINNIDVEYFKAIQTHIEQQKNKMTFKPQTVIATEEQIQQGAPAQWEATVQLDFSNFLR
jgi:hypothetical protein